METHRPILQGIDILVHQRIGTVQHFLGRAFSGNLAIGQDDDGSAMRKVSRVSCDKKMLVRPMVSLSWRIRWADAVPTEIGSIPVKGSSYMMTNSGSSAIGARATGATPPTMRWASGPPRRACPRR